VYDDNEYHAHLHDPDWTKGETDQLLEMAKRFELRWPVIYDRWCSHFDYTNNDQIPHNRRIEDLQARYYTVAAILMQRRIVTEAAQETHALQAQANEALEAEHEEAKRATTDALLIESAAAKSLATSDPKHQPLMSNIGTGSTNKPAFDLKYERERRAHQELLWKRTKEEDEEEARLRKELKEVETQLRKLKKAGAHVAASKRSGARGANAPAPEVTPETIQTAFAAMSPTPMPGTPYLQSARLVPPTPGAGVNKNLLGRMKEILQEMKVPETPIPTKRVCDLYDSVRRDILSLLVLQKSVLQKEGLLQSKRLVVNKRGGNIQTPDEETLLGIDKVTAPPAASAVPLDSQTVSAMKSTGQDKTPRGGGKTPRSTVSNKSGSINDSRRGIPAVISTGDPEGSTAAQVVVSGNASQGKQAKKVGAPKRKRKSLDANKNTTSGTTDPPPAATEESTSPATQKATDPANPPKSSGKKRQKKAEKTVKETA
jgi:hypothetical protein